VTAATALGAATTGTTGAETAWGGTSWRTGAATGMGRVMTGLAGTAGGKADRRVTGAGRMRARSAVAVMTGGEAGTGGKARAGAAVGAAAGTGVGARVGAG
jgi:hypothetical protein